LEKTIKKNYINNEKDENGSGRGEEIKPKRVQWKRRRKKEQKRTMKKKKMTIVEKKKE